MDNELPKLIDALDIELCSLVPKVICRKKERHIFVTPIGMLDTTRETHEVRRNGSDLRTAARTNMSFASMLNSQSLSQPSTQNRQIRLYILPRRFLYLNTRVSQKDMLSADRLLISDRRVISLT